MPNNNAPLIEFLSRLDKSSSFIQLLSLCAQQAIYIITENNTVLYWSAGMEQLTGINSAEVLTQTAPLDYRLTKQNSSQLINLIHAQGYEITLKKTVKLLQDTQGNSLGGFVLLESYNEELPVQTTTHNKQNFHGIISRSPAMRAVFQIIENAAETAATVLVRGESGSGKELVAKAIHQLSARKNAPFLAINCAALSSNLLESELFGHVRGAFTGAIKDHTGLFQRAHGGTLFLDEVAELPLDLQAKLLRVVQEKNYLPVGGTQTISVDVRLVAATHRSLREQVKNGQFREDLMYRLRVVPIFIPPLRERREDICLLLWHFIHLHNAQQVRRIEKIDPAAMRLLLDYPWRGNVRELHNVIEYAFAVGRGTVLRPSELPPEFREPQPVESPVELRHFKLLSPEVEASAIRQALVDSRGAITPAARSLGMSRATFWRKRKLYDL
ncbi:MAG: sigma 54-interacting transcriptional regulator [Methylococcaceae bacterium]